MGLKTRSLGQIKEIPCLRSIGHISCSIDFKTGQNVCFLKSMKSLNLGHLGSKTRSLGQIRKIPCGRSSGHISCSIDVKIGQNVCIDVI